MAALSPGRSLAAVTVQAQHRRCPRQIGTAKLNGADPQAWLAVVLERIAGLPVSRLPEAPAVELATAHRLRPQSRLTHHPSAAT
jgi:IS66 C-terminal element